MSKTTRAGPCHVLVFAPPRCHMRLANTGQLCACLWRACMRTLCARPAARAQRSQLRSRAGMLRRGSVSEVWVLSAVLETLAIDDYVRPTSDMPEAADPRRVLPRAALRFEFVGGSVASTVADLLIRLFALGIVQLQTVSVTCLGFFLRGQRSYVKDMIASAECARASCISAARALAHSALVFAQSWKAVGCTAV